MRKTIALVTDFGTTDPFVGVMKGVIARIAPDAHIIDISHAVPPQDIRAGALALLSSYRYFPSDTIFVVIVDPGVGSTRRPIAIRAGDAFFVAPDNGVLSYVLQEAVVAERVLLDNPAYHLQSVSNTFHGRDIFAPVAAHLASGVPVQQMGSPLSSWHLLDQPALTADEDRIAGEVMQIDRFGNVVTSIGRFQWLEDGHLRLHPAFGADIAPRVSLARRCSVSIGDTRVDSIRHTYSDAYPGATVALIGSGGFLELSINLGSFADVFSVQIGDQVTLEAG